MAATLLGCGCQCSANVDPCNCAGATVSLECRQRTGVATIRGWSELTDPSLPPRKYKIAQYSGSATARKYSDNVDVGCGEGNIDTTTVAASGQKAWNVVTDTQEPSAATLTWTYVQTSGLPTTDGGSCTVPGAPVGVGFFMSGCSSRLNEFNVDADTKTRMRRGIWGAVVTVPPGDPDYPAIGCREITTTTPDFALEAEGVVEINLTSEDTEDDAIDRSGAVWSAWTTGPTGVCCAGKETRGAGDFTFGFNDAEYRLKAVGAPNALVNVEVFFMRRAYGSSGAYAEAYSETVQLSAGATGEGDWQTFQVPNDSGFETCISRIVTTPVS